MKKMNEGTAFLCRAALIAACYTVLTFVTVGFSSGAIQFRFSEALCILAVFTPAAIPGMTVGCLLSNLIAGCTLFDLIFGTLATLIGTVGARMLRRFPYAAPLPYVAANTVAIPLILKFVYGSPESVWFFVLTIGISELVSAWGLGTLLYRLLKDKVAKLLK